MPLATLVGVASVPLAAQQLLPCTARRRSGIMPAGDVLYPWATTSTSSPVPGTVLLALLLRASVRGPACRTVDLERVGPVVSGVVITRCGRDQLTHGRVPSATIPGHVNTLVLVDLPVRLVPGGARHRGPRRSSRRHALAADPAPRPRLDAPRRRPSILLRSDVGLSPPPPPLESVRRESDSRRRARCAPSSGHTSTLGHPATRQRSKRVAGFVFSGGFLAVHRKGRRQVHGAAVD